MKAQELFKVEGLVVAITGGASGIGQAYAEVMAANGAVVTLIDINAPALDETALALRATGAEVHTEVADVTQPESIRAAIDAVVARHGRLDVMFANAGISGGPGFLTPAGQRNESAALENIDLAVWDRVMSTNVRSVFITLQCVVPHMKRQGGGRVIVTSSMSAVKTETLVSGVYANSKGALAHMVPQVALELAKFNILVNAIAPGPVVTNIGGGRLKLAESRAPFEAAAPLHRVASPDDLKGAALYFASPASRHVTGTQILVDGGTALGPAD